MEFSQLWWGRVPNASDFIVSVGEQILAGDKSIALVLPEYLPWHDTFQDSVEEYVRQQNSVNAFLFLQSPTGTVGEALFHRFCNEEIAADYRPSQSYASFLASRQDIELNRRYIWVQNIPPAQMQEWMRFLADYHASVKNGNPSAVFLLEVDNTAPKAKGVVPMEYEGQISLFDAYTFSMMGISQLRIAPSMKPYLLELIFSICGSDIQLCAACIENATLLLEADVTALATHLQNWGGDAETCTEQRLRKQIWAAQVKILFPIIEDLRETLVNRYYDVIAARLPLEGSGAEMCNNPEDVEMGTLHYLVITGMVQVESDDAALIANLRKTRNELAHLHMLDLPALECALSVV